MSNDDLIETLYRLKGNLSAAENAGAITDSVKGQRACEAAIKTLRAQAAEIERLRSAFECIAALTASGPHTSAKDGMSAALAALDRARDIARTALAPKEASHD